MRAEQRGAAVNADDLRRIGVLRGLDELDLARAVRLEFLRIQPRTQQRVGQQLDHQRTVAREELPVHADGLGTGGGRERAAHAFQRVGEFESAAFAGAAIQKTRDQRSHAGLVRGIGERATTHEAAERDHRHVLLRDEHDGEAVGQHEPLMGRHFHAGRCRLRRLRIGSRGAMRNRDA
jgi:hypothetical protein